MQCRPRQLLSTWTWTIAIILVGSAMLTNGHEGHEKGKTKNVQGNSTALTSLESGKNSSVLLADVSQDYEWHNPDDYPNDEAAPHDEESHHQNKTGSTSVPEKTPPSTPAKDSSAIVPTTDAPSSVNLTQSSNDTEEVAQRGNETVSEGSLPSQLPTNETNVDAGLPADYNFDENSSGEEANHTSSEVVPPNDEDDDSVITVNQPVQSNSTVASTAVPTTEIASNSTTAQPLPIETQDAGEHYTNYTAPPKFEDEDVDNASAGGSRTWAVVIFSVLICFAVLFTLLYFVRGAVLRRRKADQRKLLRGSISSEGYFYGDGDGNHVGKFEL